MKNYLISIYSTLAMNGIDILKFMRAVRGGAFYLRDLREIKKQQRKSTISFVLKKFPCLGDKFAEGGEAKGHYFHQDLLVARRIYAANPKRHVDVGSRIDGFVAHVASFRKIEVFDIRPIQASIPNIKFVQYDLMADISESYSNYCDSLSCLHALEHFGLGRYGDPIKYDGYIDGLENLSKILTKGGTFYLSVPIGPQRIEFNAHRVFSLNYLVSILSDKFKVIKFSYIDDHGALHEGITLNDDQTDNFCCNYGCGVFELEKK